MISRNRRRTMLFTVRKSAGFFACLTLSLFILTGCAATVPKTVAVPDNILQDYLAGKPAQLKGMYAKVLQEGKRNFVLNQLQVGVAAMELGEFDLARESFDEALLNIEAVYANNPEAAKARSLWYEEGSKDYKGEPYERAMAYYYRGILYLMEADYENARACFKSGMLQDAFVEEDQNQYDFALMAFLTGWASQQLGDRILTKDAYAELKVLRPDFELPNPEDNVLILVETGKSPRKVSDGVGHAELKYRRGKRFKEERALVQYNDQGKKMAFPMEDIFYQAATRGGRPVDKILEGKAVFMQTGLGIGTALTEMSSAVTLTNAALSNSDSAGAVGAALGVVGGVASLIAINAKPHADTRYWKNLPDVVHVMTRKSSGPAQVTVDFVQKDLAPTEIPPKTVSVFNDRKGSGLVWVRSQKAILN